MTTITGRRALARSLLCLALLAAATTFLVANAQAATPSPPGGAKLASCMKAKGLTFPPANGADLAKSGYRSAMQACAKAAGVTLTPRAGGGTPQALRKYAACMKKHGVDINPASGSRPDRSSKAYGTANGACGKLLRG